MDILNDLTTALGPDGLSTGKDAERWSHDWTGAFKWRPIAVARPRSTQEVSDIVRLCHEANVAVVPVGGNSGLTGATIADGAIMISLDRMNKIEEIRPQAHLAVVQAGVILSAVHDAAADHDLSFPMTFGAKGTAQIGGILGTNAGGSNVVRYGNTRDLVLGIEVVLPDGRIMDLMSELHKDNSGLNLRNLFIGAEGTLGIVTRAVLKLATTPGAFATAMVAVPTLGDALTLLNRLQAATAGSVEVFEYMPRRYMELHTAHFHHGREPFEGLYDVNIMVEVGATAPRDILPTQEGAIPVVDYLETVLGEMLEEDQVLDAVVAKSNAQRAEMWQRREDAAELTFSRLPHVNSDVAVAIDHMDSFLTQVNARVEAIDPGCDVLIVAHLGDGNIHHTVYPTTGDPAIVDAIKEATEEVTLAFRGSFSAEHGIGVTKLKSMARRKDSVALDVMARLKDALDPKGIMNPGKVYPRV